MARKPPKKRFGSKAKGSSFEREVCRRLSLWVSAGVRDDLYWRSAMSGGRATVRFKKGRKTDTQLGDISAIHSDGQSLLDKVIIECKNVRDLNLTAAAFKCSGFLYKVWEDLLTLATGNNKAPMLIAKQNKCQPIMMVSPEYADANDFFIPPFVLWHGSDNEAYLYYLDDVAPLPEEGGSNA